MELADYLTALDIPPAFRAFMFGLLAVLLYLYLLYLIVRNGYGMQSPQKPPLKVSGKEPANNFAANSPVRICILFAAYLGALAMLVSLQKHRHIKPHELHAGPEWDMNGSPARTFTSSAPLATVTHFPKVIVYSGKFWYMTERTDWSLHTKEISAEDAAEFSPEDRLNLDL